MDKPLIPAALLATPTPHSLPHGRNAMQGTTERGTPADSACQTHCDADAKTEALPAYNTTGAIHQMSDDTRTQTTTVGNSYMILCDRDEDIPSMPISADNSCVISSPNLMPTNEMVEPTTSDGIITMDANEPDRATWTGAVVVIQGASPPDTEVARPRHRLFSAPLVTPFPNASHDA